EDHEAKSCAMAKAFLGEQGYPGPATDKVCALIMATRMDHEPRDLMESIIKDADLSHFVQKTYWDTTEKLREELKSFGVADYSDRQWREKNIQIFQDQHQFYTDYARLNWQAGKDDNLNQLLKEKKAEKNMRKK